MRSEEARKSAGPTKGAMPCEHNITIVPSTYCAHKAAPASAAALEEAYLENAVVNPYPGGRVNNQPPGRLRAVRR